MRELRRDKRERKDTAGMVIERTQLRGEAFQNIASLTSVTGDRSVMYYTH
jgi:hypothetical protein